MYSPKCESNDINEEYAFPRENLDDKEYECMECGHEWLVIAHFEEIHGV
jgi:hypothetical protein